MLSQASKWRPDLCGTGRRVATYSSNPEVTTLVDSIGTAAPDKPAKPAKPYQDFPLYAHATKRWTKKIKGRTHFFGPSDDRQDALERYQYEGHWLQQGKTPPPRDQQSLTVGDLVNEFLEHREAKVASGEMAKRTWDDYKRTGTTTPSVKLARPERFFRMLSIWSLPDRLVVERAQTPSRETTQ